MESFPTHSLTLWSLTNYISLNCYLLRQVSVSSLSKLYIYVIILYFCLYFSFISLLFCCFCLSLHQYIQKSTKTHMELSQDHQILTIYNQVPTQSSFLMIIFLLLLYTTCILDYKYTLKYTLPTIAATLTHQKITFPSAFTIIGASLISFIS